jgi:hypothetical protein
LTTSARPRTWARSSAATTVSGSMPVSWLGTMWPSLSNQKLRQPPQHLALAGDRVGQDDVEGRQAIAGDDQQLVGIDGVDVAHLAAAEQRQAGDRRFLRSRA